MSTENYRIEKYQFEVRSETQNGKVRNIGLLYLYGKGHELLAAIVFVPGADALEKPALSPNGQVAAQMYIQQQALVIDMLRNEKPVFFSWSPEEQRISLSTDEEPVGEQELRRLFSWLYI